MNEPFYRKHRGWNGAVYYCRMPEREIEDRRRIGVAISTILGPIMLVAVWVIASGVLHL
jgi:hypothetical protein